MTRSTSDQLTVSQLQRTTFDLSKEKGLSDEELQRRLKQPGRPLAEMLRDLENRFPKSVSPEGERQ
jgi:hypothetical protein